MRVNGIRRLQQPQVYIGAVVAAFILYYLDKYYGFGYIVARAEDELKQIKSNIKVNREDEASPVDNLWIFLLAVTIITLLLAVKRVYDRRNQARAILIAEDSGIQAAEGKEVCEKISQEEYDYQTSVLTKQEITKLVNSAAYKKMVQEKGSCIEDWNWQAKERSMGILPVVQENSNQVLNEDFELVDESKVEEETDKRKRQSLKSPAPRVNS